MTKVWNNQTFAAGPSAKSIGLFTYFMAAKAEVLILVLSIFFVSAAFLPMTLQGEAMSDALDANRLREIGFLLLSLMLLSWLCYKKGGLKTSYQNVFIVITGIFLFWVLLFSPWSNMPALSVAKALELGIVISAAAMVVSVAAGRWVLLDKFPELLFFSILLLIGVYLVLNVFIWGTPFPVVDPIDPDSLEIVTSLEPVRLRFSLAFAHPLLAADVFAIGLVCCLSSGIRKQYRFALAVVPFALLWMTYARGALAAAIAAVCVMIFFSIRQFGLKVVSILIVCGIFPLIFLLDLLSLGVSVWGNEATSLNGRVNLWASVFEVFLRRPITGFGYFATRSLTMTEFEWAGHAHNTFFEVLLTTGIIGGILFIVFTVCLIYLLIKTNDRLLLGVSVYCYVAGFLNPLLFTPGFPMFMLMLCILRAYVCRRRRDFSINKRRDFRKFAPIGNLNEAVSSKR